MKCFDSELKIIDLDNHLLLIHKPAKLLSQPTKDEERSAENLGKSWIKEKYKKAGNVYLTPLFRLDRSVSGLLLFAKTSKAAQRFNDQRKKLFISKNYLALVEGTFSEKEGLLEDKMGHGDFRAEEGDKEAALIYRVLEENEGVSLLEIELLTGRYHQIRYQLSRRGHPILGDEKYGSRIPFAPGVIALHHHRLAFFHPVTNEINILNSKD